MQSILSQFKQCKMTLITFAICLPLFCTASDITLSQQNFYAGEKYRTMVTLSEKISNQSGVAWSINYLGAEIGTGSSKLSGNGTFDIEITAPRLNHGITAKATLICKNISGVPTAPIFFRSAEIFTPAESAALEVNVLKTGSEEPLTTAMNRHGIAFKTINSTDEFAGKTLLICGADFDENTDMSKTVTTLAAQGKTVIILPPLKGHFAAGDTAFERIFLGKAADIKNFNHDFDILRNSGSFAAVAWDNALALNCMAQQNGFSYGIFKTAGGAIFITTWDLPKMVKDNPSALYLLKILFSGIF